MKPEELRIGNWVTYKGLDVRWSIEDFTEWSKANRIADYLEPIPLTDEWLERFGFYGKHKSINTRESKVFFDYNSKSIEIKYVHQLQNLYYALTKKEL